MAKRGHGEEQILRVLRVAEFGDTVVEVCRKHADQSADVLPEEEVEVVGWVGIA